MMLDDLQRALDALRGLDQSEIEKYYGDDLEAALELLEGIREAMTE